MDEAAPGALARPSRAVRRAEWHDILEPAFVRPIPPDAVFRMATLWNRASGEAMDPRLVRLVEVLNERFRTDVARYSGVFEPSFSFDGYAWRCVRFSYAFPDFWDEPDRVCRTVLDSARPFGPRTTSHVARLLRWSFQPFIEQPIVGLAYDGPESWTFKFYYQVDLRFHEQAIQWLARLVPWGSLRWLLGGGALPLHLVGLDLGPSGIRCVKLYLLHQGVATHALAGVLWPQGLTDFLVRRGVVRLSNLLTIHRLRSPDDPAIRQVSEADFPLVENGLHDVLLFGDTGLVSTAFPNISLPPGCSERLPRFLCPSDLPDTLLRVVRLTVSVSSAPKLNLYLHVVQGAADG